MNRLYYTFLLCCCFFAAQTQPKTRLIVRGDDMGFSHATNEALIKSYKEGIETSIEVIVPSPWFLEAAKMLQQTPSVDVGIHLCLTSEWDNIKWRPLTNVTSLRDSNGYFFPKVYPDKSHAGQAIMENRYSLSDIEREFRAQIEMAKRHIPRISHISGHMACTHFSNEVKALTQRLAKEYNLLTDMTLTEGGVQFVTYTGEKRTALEKFESFKKTVETFEVGKTYLFLDHPSYDNAEMRAVHHIGYKDVAEDRQGVTDLFTNETLKFLLKDKNIELISYADWLRTQYFPNTVELVTQKPPRQNVWAFIMAGQSNMAGRGYVEPQDTLPNKRILTINKDFNLVYAKEPLHFYEPRMTGLDCGMSFGRSLLSFVPDSVSILLIPTAVGGSSIQEWIGDSTFREVKLMSNFKEKVKLANMFGTVKGVLWHQGESNSTHEEDIKAHASNLTQLFKIFRNITHNETLPIVVGELGAYSNNNANWQRINATLKEVVQKDGKATLVNTQDLRQRGDYIHFNSEGQRIMGERMARAYWGLKK